MACITAKLRTERSQTTKADLVANVGDGHFGMRQKILCLLNSPTDQVAVGCNAEHTPKRPNKVMARKAD